MSTETATTEATPISNPYQSILDRYRGMIARAEKNQIQRIDRFSVEGGRLMGKDICDANVAITGAANALRYCVNNTAMCGDAVAVLNGIADHYTRYNSGLVPQASDAREDAPAPNVVQAKNQPANFATSRPIPTPEHAPHYGNVGKPGARGRRDAFAKLGNLDGFKIQEGALDL